MNASDWTRALRLLVLTTVAGATGALPSMLGGSVRAQTPAVKFDVRAAKGLVVSPVYEGAVDEMAHLNEQLIYITEEDYRRIVEERKKRTSTGN